MRMGVAEYMTAVSTMMPTFEQTKGFLAQRVVANGGVNVWLPMLSSWQPCNFIHILIEKRIIVVGDSPHIVMSGLIPS